MNNFWKHKRVFVTGANGFLGSHLCEELVGLGAEVVGLVRDDVPNAYFVQQQLDKKIIQVHGDLASEFLLERVFNEYEIDTCFHLAAQPLVGVANRSPRSTFESNMRGTWNLFEAARTWKKLRGICVASSDKAYGDSDQLPYVENQPLFGKNPYDLSKTVTDMLAQSYYHTYQLPVAISRCGNFYGPGDLNWSRIVPGTYRSYLRNEAPIIRSDGTLVRDYFFVKDVVSSYLTLGEHLTEEKVVGQAFNFGTEDKISVLDLVKKMQKIAGRDDLAPVVQGINNNEIPAQYLNVNKAKETFGWSAKVSLDEGLKQTYDWYKAFLANEVS